MPTLFGKAWTRQELMRYIGHISQVGGVQLLASDDGPARGVRYLDFRTGTGFNFKVAIERGMDVAYCENLVLTRRYTARLGESRFFMHDEIENAGFLSTEHMLLYHMNIGFPIVEAGSELVAPVTRPPAIPDGLPIGDPSEYTRFIS